MSRSRVSQDFAASAAAARRPAAAKRDRPAPFSIRLSAEERAHLERKAGTRPLGAYIRDKLLDGSEAQPRKPSRAPSIDAATLAQVLGQLGQSDQVKILFLLAVAAEEKRVRMGKVESAALRQACADIRAMRHDLIKALGLKSGEAR